MGGGRWGGEQYFYRDTNEQWGKILISNICDFSEPPPRDGSTSDLGYKYLMGTRTFMIKNLMIFRLNNNKNLLKL